MPWPGTSRRQAARTLRARQEALGGPPQGVSAGKGSGLPRSSRVPKVVFDTNVVLSALVFARGPTSRLREIWRAGGCVALISSDTAQELIRVLAYPKFRLTASDQEELLADYLPYAHVIPMPESLPAVPDCRDPADVPFLRLAAAGRAQFLVTGDADCSC